ncbi:MAG: hypothetical protein ACTSPS_15265 [Promethearchaeota archaeon]
MDKNQKEIYEYADGSGNTYIIKNALKIFIEYIPIKPQLSSSGFYDGGDYKKKEITKNDFNNISTIFEKALRSKENHIENRIKTSGLLSIQEEDKKKVCILKPNSRDLLEIEQLLKDILNSK